MYLRFYFFFKLFFLFFFLPDKIGCLVRFRKSGVFAFFCRNLFARLSLKLGIISACQSFLSPSLSTSSVLTR